MHLARMKAFAISLAAALGAWAVLACDSDDSDTGADAGDAGYCVLVAQLCEGLDGAIPYECCDGLACINGYCLLCLAPGTSCSSDQECCGSQSRPPQSACVNMVCTCTGSGCHGSSSTDGGSDSAATSDVASSSDSPSGG